MQMNQEAWGEAAMALSDFVRALPVCGPDGKQLPQKVEPVLENDVLVLAINFSRADRHISDQRTKMAFTFCKHVQNDWAAIGCALVDKIDGESSLMIRQRKPLVDDELAKLKQDIQKQWSSVGLVEPSSIALVQGYDHAFGTKFTDTAKNLLLRIAFHLMNADGPPSQESQHVFDQYGRLVAKAGSSVDQSILDQAGGPWKSTSTETGLTTALTELRSLIGLAQVKEDVAELANYIKVQQLRRSRGMKLCRLSWKWRRAFFR
jgi:hypothetical protein